MESLSNKDIKYLRLAVKALKEERLTILEKRNESLNERQRERLLDESIEYQLMMDSILKAIRIIEKNHNCLRDIQELIICFSNEVYQKLS